MAVALRETSQGIVLLVRAQPGARRRGVRGEQAGALKVCVTEAAEKGKATAAVTEVLCEALGLRASQVSLIAGATSRAKQFLVTGVTRTELEARIQAALAAADK